MNPTGEITSTATRLLAKVLMINKMNRAGQKSAGRCRSLRRGPVSAQQGCLWFSCWTAGSCWCGLGVITKEIVLFHLVKWEKYMFFIFQSLLKFKKHICGHAFYLIFMKKQFFFPTKDKQGILVHISKKNFISRLP